jgi:lipoprotein-anchoring transpeptidase ErfK/SrfK
MIARWFLGLLIFGITSISVQAQDFRGQSIEIDLQDQMAYLVQGGRVALAAPISSGRAGHLTETGAFKIIEKEQNHYSNMYGKIVDARGNTIVSDADADMPVPRGGRFIPAPMRFFMRFNGSIGMHAGYLPGYPASHGCVRLPEADAIALFESVDVGTPVNVFGRTRVRRSSPENEFSLRQRRPFEPRQVGRYFAPPAWWR